MKMIYRSANQKTNIFYGKTLSSQLKETENDTHMLFVTNQRYYDLFAAKINQLFPDQTKVDWHICTNSPQCNQLSELENLLGFTKKFPEKEEYLIVGFGNEGIMDLAAFFSKEQSVDFQAVADTRFDPLNGKKSDRETNDPPDEPANHANQSLSRNDLL
ncbi:hypothetical protein D920_02817 [Enterococcus faecalis 13-SD-W-01]|nr:hypothetical protein D920_02817 [Enterococcus faecalis 13-SD-W-01]